eukprot:Lithocolla_globosa_v1_NODE_276_length_4701_cov_75.277443.p3 type:complete len:111 gc:universal NODE_276_length_4701_cov_75.277443:221-553(+)
MYKGNIFIRLLIFAVCSELTARQFFRCRIAYLVPPDDHICLYTPFYPCSRCKTIFRSVLLLLWATHNLREYHNHSDHSCITTLDFHPLNQVFRTCCKEYLLLTRHLSHHL